MCGIKKSAYSMIENGYTQLSARNRQAIVETLGVNMTWLDEGEGEMFRTESAAFENMDQRARYARENIRAVPLYDFDSVGRIPGPDGESEYIRDYIYFDGADNDDVAATVSGNVMAPEIPSGAIVLLRRLQDWDDIEYGRPYLMVLNDGRRLLRRIYRHHDEKKSDSHLILRASGSSFEPGTLPVKMISNIFTVRAIYRREVF